MLPAGDPALLSLGALPDTFPEGCPVASKLDEHIAEKHAGRDAYKNWMRTIGIPNLTLPESYDSQAALLAWSLSELRVAAGVAGGSWQNGAHQRFARCPQDHVQRREAWQATSLDQTLFQSGYQVLASHDEAR